MTDDLKLYKAKERGAQAEALLRNELLKETFEYLEKRFIEEMLSTQFRDSDARERLWQAVNIGRKYQDLFTQYIANGKIAQAELNGLSGLNKIIA